MFEPKVSKGTRKGVKSNRPGIKLINITDGAVVRRVGRNIADPLVASGGWKYCPKKFKI